MTDHPQNPSWPPIVGRDHEQVIARIRTAHGDTAAEAVHLAGRPLPERFAAAQARLRALQAHAARRW
jgi:hypothetical protein